MMAFCFVSSEEDVMHTQVIEKGLWVNLAIYLDVMEKVGVSWCKQIALDRPLVR